MSFGTFTQGNEAGKSPSDPVFHCAFTMVGDAAYPTGGTLGFAAALSAAYPNRSFSATSIIAARGGATGYVAEYLPATDALKVYVRTTGVEVANTTDLSAVTFDMYVVAK